MQTLMFKKYDYVIVNNTITEVLKQFICIEQHFKQTIYE